jgi:head-tail adaptor
MVLNAGHLTRRIQIQRATETPDAFGGAVQTWDDLGNPIFARRRDVSDAERISAGRYDNLLVARFTVRATPYGRGIRRSDRLVHDGLIWQIDAIKEALDSRAFIEITAQTADAP